MMAQPLPPDAAPLHWGAEALWEQLSPRLPGLSIEVVARIASTNSALLDRARVASEARDEADGSAAAQVRRSTESQAFGRRAADLQPCLLVAEHQTAGRGRLGRPWQSLAGASLTFSLALPLHPADWAGLSLAVGVALADALDPINPINPINQAPAGPRPRIGIKWPNDLWLMDAAGDAGRKLGGILIETVSSGGQRLVVIGVGLNVLPLSISSLEASTGFACLQELQAGIGAPEVLARVALPLVDALHRFERSGFAAFADAFAARDVLFQRAITTTQADLPAGVAQGVSSTGALQVQTAQGMRLLSSGEVSVRPVAGAAPVPGTPC